jgi:hypothetical protein
MGVPLSVVENSTVEDAKVVRRAANGEKNDVPKCGEETPSSRRSSWQYLRLLLWLPLLGSTVIV